MNGNDGERAVHSLEEEVKEIKEQVRRELELLPVIDDESVVKLIDEVFDERRRKKGLKLTNEKEQKTEIFNSIRRLDVLQSFMDDEAVTEIMVNGLHSIFIEKDGRLIDSGKAFSSKERLEDIIQQIAAGANRTVNTASPIVDARLPDGARVNVVLEPVAVNGPILTIRRFPREPISDRRLIETGSVTEEVLIFLKKLVAAKYNLIISGGTGSGKTTFLNILSGYIPKTERIITIEDSAELQIRGISNLVSLETRNANVEGVKPITIRDLIKASLRMRPDRVVVGEVRGEEAIDMLQAMNVGMDGSLSTIHANSAKDALSRLEAMMLMSTEVPIAAIRSQMASGIDIIIQLGRLRDKSRHLLEVIEVTGYDGKDISTQVLYTFREEGEKNGRVAGMMIKENELIHRDKLQRAGISL
ncbi:MAG: CpaF family protein [Lachnospiraceae bacterium]|nr:CpaF family protein [Lachnospiraceae bacterium]